MVCIPHMNLALAAFGIELFESYPFESGDVGGFIHHTSSSESHLFINRASGMTELQSQGNFPLG
jgi:hypothetical protein